LRPRAGYPAGTKNTISFTTDVDSGTLLALALSAGRDQSLEMGIELDTA
jgi:hypothetical protein